MLPFTKNTDKHYTVSLPANLDFEVHKAFRDTLHEIMSHEPEEIQFDFKEVDYIDSAGLGMLMLARQETSTKECKLILANLADGHPRKVLEMVKFDQLFNVDYN